MHLALWNTPPADVFVAGLLPRASPWDVQRHTPQVCSELLLRGQVDVALLPTLVVLNNTDLLDVLPAAALSTWAYPYAKLVLHQDLARVGTVVFDPDHAQEALVARIVLQEHYGIHATFVPMPGASPREVLTAGQAAALVVGPEAPSLQTDDLTLDLGQEWFELANYPMVWGLFAARKDEATPAMVEALWELVDAAEQQRHRWVEAHDMLPAAHHFFTEDLRLRFDDLATASLTEFRQYLYFYNVTEDILDLPLFLLPDDDSEEDDQT